MGAGKQSGKHKSCFPCKKMVENLPCVSDLLTIGDMLERQHYMSTLLAKRTSIKWVECLGRES